MNNRPSPSGSRNPFRIRTSENQLPQPLQNQHFHDPLGSAHSKGLTARGFRPQPLYFQHLRAPLVTAENKRLITPLESALTKNRGEGTSLSRYFIASLLHCLLGASGKSVGSAGGSAAMASSSG